MRQAHHNQNEATDLVLKIFTLIVMVSIIYSKYSQAQENNPDSKVDNYVDALGGIRYTLPAILISRQIGGAMSRTQRVISMSILNSANLLSNIYPLTPGLLFIRHTGLAVAIGIFSQLNRESGTGDQKAQPEQNNQGNTFNSNNC